MTAVGGQSSLADTTQLDDRDQRALQSMENTLRALDLTMRGDEIDRVYRQAFINVFGEGGHQELTVLGSTLELDELPALNGFETAALTCLEDTGLIVGKYQEKKPSKAMNGLLIMYSYGHKRVFKASTKNWGYLLAHAFSHTVDVCETAAEVGLDLYELIIFAFGKDLPMSIREKIGKLGDQRADWLKRKLKESTSDPLEAKQAQEKAKKSEDLGKENAKKAEKDGDVDDKNDKAANTPIEKGLQEMINVLANNSDVSAVTKKKNVSLLLIRRKNMPDNVKETLKDSKFVKLVGPGCSKFYMVLDDEHRAEKCLTDAGMKFKSGKFNVNGFP